MIDFDSDQQIMDATVVQDGYWRFFDNKGELMVEAKAPPKMNMHVLGEWSAAVRGKWNARNDIDTEEILARKKRRRENGDLDVPGDNTVPSPEPTDRGSDSVPVTGDMGLDGLSFEEDPEAYAVARWKYHCDMVDSLNKKLEEAMTNARKWERIAAAAQGEDDGV